VTFVAANSIIFSVELIIGAFPSGFGSTTSLLIGMEKERDGDAAAARLCRRIVRMSVIVNLIQIAVVLLLANQIVGMFSPQSESVAVMAAWGLRLYALSVLPNTVNYIVRNYEQNMNHTGAAYFICLMNHIALPAAVGFMLMTFAQLRYIWLCFVIGQGACLLITWYIMRKDAMAIQKETVS
jgi:Na+-driven multidrug efflux pump